MHCTECPCPQEGSPEQPRCQAGHRGVVVAEVTAGAGVGLGTSWWHLVTPLQWEHKACTAGFVGSCWWLGLMKAVKGAGINE